MKEFYTYLLVIFACMAWGVGFPIAKVGVSYIHPFTFAFIRFSLVSVLFLVLFKLSVHDLALKLKYNFMSLFFMALTGVFLYGVFFLFALKFAKASDVSLISGANPIITSLVAWVVLKERLSFVGKIGVLVSFLGIVFIVSKGNWYILKSFRFEKGELFMLIATTLWAIYSVITKNTLRRVSVFEAVCLTSFLGAIIFMPLSFLYGNINNIVYYPLKAWLSVVYMALFSTVFAFSAWYRSIEKIGASRSSVFVNLVPVFGVITAVIFLGESISFYEIIGGLLVIAGVIMTNSRRVFAKSLYKR